MRILIAALALATLIVAAPLAGRKQEIPSVGACDYGPERVDDYFRAAGLIALVDVVAVGDSINAAPTLSATATFPLASTPTPEGTPTPAPGLRIRLTPPATNTPQLPARPPLVIDGDLSGIGAQLSVVEIYVGDAPSPFTADAAVRSSIERRIRDLEAGYGYASTCPVAGLTPRYEEAARYLGVFKTDPSGQFVTTRLFLVDGSEVVNANAVGMSYGLYRDYFADLKAGDVTYPTDDPPAGYVYVTEPRFALTRLLQAVRAARTTDYRIYPPNTGTAGLLPAQRTES